MNMETIQQMHYAEHQMYVNYSVCLLVHFLTIQKWVCAYLPREKLRSWFWLQWALQTHGESVQGMV